MRDTIDAVYRTESRRILATLIRLLGDFDLAEEAMQDAFTAAVEQWPTDGVPGRPRSWLISADDYTIGDDQLRAEGSAVVQRTLAMRRIGAFTLQAAIAAVHAESPTAEAADWVEIVGPYDGSRRAASNSRMTALFGNWNILAAYCKSPVPSPC